MKFKKSQSLPIKIVMLQFLLAAILAATLVVAADEEKGYDGMDIVEKSPVELCKMRGFEAEEEFALTPDGYKLPMIHLRNPKIKSEKLKRPVLFLHGFMSSATVFLANSNRVKPLKMEDYCPSGSELKNLRNSNDTHLVNGPFMLANRGFDVWLFSARGTEFSSHNKFKREQPEFWQFSIDDIALKDLPTAIDHVIEKTGAKKIGLVAHSQGTFSGLGLLSKKPDYGDKLEPVVLVAPIAFLENIHSVLTPLLNSKLISQGAKIDVPFPPFATELRKSMLKICDSELNRLICTFVASLASGEGKLWPKGFFSLIPYSTSFRVARQFAQLFQSKKMQMFDFGRKENIEKYGSETPPEYPLKSINSKSLCIISTNDDKLATPKDVAKLKSVLKDADVKLYGDLIVDRNDINHNDLVLDVEGAKITFSKVLEWMEEIESKTGICAKPKRKEHKDDDDDDHDHDEDEPVNNAIDITGFDWIE